MELSNFAFLGLLLFIALAFIGFLDKKKFRESVLKLLTTYVGVFLAFGLGFITYEYQQNQQNLKLSKEFIGVRIHSTKNTNDILTRLQQASKSKDKNLYSSQLQLQKSIAINEFDYDLVAFAHLSLQMKQAIFEYKGTLELLKRSTKLQESHEGIKALIDFTLPLMQEFHQLLLKEEDRINGTITKFEFGDWCKKLKHLGVGKLRDVN